MLARMFQLSPDYVETATISGEKEKRKVEVEFLKRWLGHGPGQIVSFEEDQARELIKLGYAREHTT